jgi:hypothetical protein
LHQDLLSTHRGTLLSIVARCSPSWHVASDRGTVLLISEPDFKLTLTGWMSFVLKEKLKGLKLKIKE